jgi:hypothetical protein
MRLVVIERGIIAGLVATAALSAIMLMKQSMGLTPELDLIAVITAMAGASSPAVGWIDHFCRWGRILGSRLRDRQSLPARPTAVPRSNLHLAHCQGGRS